MTTRRRAVVLLVLASVVAGVVVAGVAGAAGVRHFGASRQERYCDEVVSRRTELTDLLSVDTGDGVLQALPVFEDLRDLAPSDIADEWRVLVSALQGLAGALDEAGVDPATYDRDDVPAGVSAAERGRIDAAAQRVGSAATQEALAGLDQQSRDVCGTPLTE